MPSKPTFAEKMIKSWQEFLTETQSFSGDWIFRGQPSDRALTTSLERACNDFGISLKKAPGIEKQLIRDFKRQYSGADRDFVLNDTLYCLALLQHHGAPTRLLDWTYSPFVAAFFALEKKLSSKCVVWCLSADWCHKQAALIAEGNLVEKRNKDETRTDKTFDPLYMRNSFKLVLPENPLLLNERLIIQKGVFLCPGDVSAKFETNLKKLKDWYNENSIVKLKFNMEQHEHLKAIEELQNMNVDNRSLFPGLDGLCKSLTQKFPVYEKMAAKQIGE